MRYSTWSEMLLQMLPFVLKVDEYITLVSQREMTSMLTNSILFDRVEARQPETMFS